MLRRWAAALMLAATATGVPNVAACAEARAADPFEVVPRPAPDGRSYRAAWACAITGVGLVAASFPLANLADRRYDDYLAETDPDRVDARWRATVRMDRLSSGSLLAGEALLASAVWLRFVHRSREPRATLVLLPDRCAIAVRF